MKNIIAFAGSNSKNSINKQLAIYAAGLVENVNVNVLDLNDFEFPLYGIDLENEKGIPETAHKFLNILKETDGIVLSLAEHNGTYATVFKNLFDWLTRIEGKMFFDKPMLLMATSPGGRGGLTALEIAKGRFPFHDGNIIETFSLPFFGDNFKDGKIINEDLDTQLKNAVKQYQKAL
ncbi:NADPH-dependent FMN reductase [Siansivirga zeaxanthinifaciens]|uniref:NADPH-dependent FMN reductase n=1 Tax=Siansivirga zeaxanthinifaciens CC-SAMT-1 TaxID=1454006 RepID=A0A0C5WG45_9FLAO|nr:NAD(P)H-dependent oxidoreductase [Siansivirga zeaxanthinifaciens]AJR04154.1 NADPH-dependent FMN reductase [Siansivirga zeaxanthinifaciens CC-SAMT-1]